MLRLRSSSLTADSSSLVDLQLFFGGFQLLSCALKLLIVGKNLFIRGLQFLVAGFLAFDDGLEIFPGGGQLLLELLDTAMFGLRGTRDGGGTPAKAPNFGRHVRLLENNHEVEFGEISHLEGNNFEVDVAGTAILAIFDVDLNPLLTNGDDVLFRAVQGVSETEEQAFANHLKDIETGASRGVLSSLEMSRVSML